MKFHEAAILVVLSTMVLLGITMFLSDLASRHSTTVNLAGLNGTNFILNDTNTNTTRAYDQLKDVVLEFEDATLLDIPNKLIKVGMTSIKIMLGSWADLTTMISNLIDNIGLPIPPWFSAGIITLITIIIVAIMIYAFWKWKFED